MKVFVIYSYAHDETIMHEIWNDRAKAEARMAEMKADETSKFTEYYIEEDEVRT